MARRTLAEVYSANSERLNMRNGPGTAQVGTAPLGDRPGTTTVPNVSSWKGTAAGRARIAAIGFFLTFTFVHVAAEARYNSG